MDKARNPDANENAASESAKSVQRLVSVHAIVYIQRTHPVTTALRRGR
jgi:hypothetical protein